MVTRVDCRRRSSPREGRATLWVPPSQPMDKMFDPAHLTLIDGARLEKPAAILREFARWQVRELVSFLRSVAVRRAMPHAQVVQGVVDEARLEVGLLAKETAGGHDL